MRGQVKNNDSYQIFFYSTDYTDSDSKFQEEGKDAKKIYVHS